MSGGYYTLAAAILPIFAFVVYYCLSFWRVKQYAHLPRPTPSLIWGHLATIGVYYKAGDARRHADYVFREIAQSIGSPPIVILDLRPFFWVMAIVCSHDVAEQISRSTKTFPYSTPKSPSMSALKPVIGPHSIISAQGESWKALRKRYNAGFAPSHLLTLLPGILDKTRLFLRNLDELAGTGQDFLMEPLCTNLTFDIIGSVIMDIDLKAQLAHTEQSQLVTLYRQLVESYTREEIGGVVSLNPVHKLRQYRLGKAVDRKLKELIIEKFEAGSSTMTNKKTRSVLALSLHDIDKLNPLLLQQTADQVKSFLFAGHDTTSIVLQWAFYELSRTPSALAKLRKEHDELFGPDSDPDVVAQMLLSRGDEVISKMAYTSAVIKEILRLYPPAATARRVPHGGGFFVKLPDGEEVCLDGMVLYNMHHAIQRDPEVYGSSSEIFRPERWLGNTDTSAADDDTSLSDSKAIPASGWRPFERGPRNCIGQELANLEARVILALAVRRYDFAKVDVGRLKIGSDKKPVLDETTGQYEVEDVLFNTRQITSKPFDGMKMKVTLRT